MSEPKYTVESTGPRIEAFLPALLRRACLDVQFQVQRASHPLPDFENPDVIIQFDGQDCSLLLANRAELLLALEQLTLEVLRVPSEDHSLICFDAQDYRLMRIEELRLSALAAAEKVKKTHVPFTFSPMTSRERRIVHLALRNEPDVRSESSGVGPRRQVVIYPADMPSPPQPAGTASARPPRRR